MGLFVFGIIFFVVSIFAFMISLGLWVYADATVKSRQSPALWVLIVLFVPNLVGLVIYLLVGRTNKHSPAPGKFKWLAIASAVIFALGTAAFFFGTLNFVNAADTRVYGARQVGSFVRHEENLRGGVWEISAERANGYSRRTPVLTAAELENFRAENRGGAGNVFLRVEQRGRAETFDISGVFAEGIDLLELGFQAGRVFIYVDFERAEPVNITISWR